MLRERGITRGRIGFDEASTLRDPSFWDRVKTKLPDLEAIQRVRYSGRYGW
ncbi:MAG: hypothetical protein JSV27_00180 [Candidatus Bathyarchaeota archaeon]|nr:MAG: hypothetical protein JSV27_00180 [Candidatus Bathyarchaeota archaeon]